MSFSLFFYILAFADISFLENHQNTFEMRTICLSSCNLNQWSLDFVGNRDRIIEAVARAKNEGSKLIITPELSVSGYDCMDAFLELDTVTHSLEVLAELLTNDACSDIIVDVGMPIIHQSVLFNTRVVFFNRKILFIRPKMSLANDGLFREMRFFTPWSREQGTQQYLLPTAIQKISGQQDVPLGDVVLETLDGIKIASEMW